MKPPTRLLHLAAATLLIPTLLPAQPQEGNTPPEQSTAPTERKPVRVSGGVMATLLLHKVDPITPPDARAAGMTGGAVVLAVTVAADGTVKQAQAMSGPDTFRKPATDAVTKWTYKPYLLNGQPTAVLTTVTLNFH